MNNVQSGAGEIQVLDVYGRLLQTVETCHGASSTDDANRPVALCHRHLFRKNGEWRQGDGGAEGGETVGKHISLSDALRASVHHQE